MSWFKISWNRQSVTKQFPEIDNFGTNLPAIRKLHLNIKFPTLVIWDWNSNHCQHLDDRKINFRAGPTLKLVKLLWEYRPYRFQGRERPLVKVEDSQHFWKNTKNSMKTQEKAHFEGFKKKREKEELSHPWDLYIFFQTFIILSNHTSWVYLHGVYIHGSSLTP